METPKLYKRLEAAQILNISLRTLDELIARKELRGLKIRKLRLISGDEITRYIRKMEQAAR